NNSPYKFNGKQLDEETGWYYYGARYYDPKISVWLSVDPLAEETMTPYQYTYQNPINLTDPTGMAAEDNDPPKTWVRNVIRWISDLFSKVDRGIPITIGSLETGELSYSVLNDLDYSTGVGSVWSADGYTYQQIEGYSIIRTKNGSNSFSL